MWKSQIKCISHKLTILETLNKSVLQLFIWGIMGCMDTFVQAVYIYPNINRFLLVRMAFYFGVVQ